jgi:hypothetical protein
VRSIVRAVWKACLWSAALALLTLGIVGLVLEPLPASKTMVGSLAKPPAGDKPIGPPPAAKRTIEPIAKLPPPTQEPVIGSITKPSPTHERVSPEPKTVVGTVVKPPTAPRTVKSVARSARTMSGAQKRFNPARHDKKVVKRAGTPLSLRKSKGTRASVNPTGKSHSERRVNSRQPHKGAEETDCPPSRFKNYRPGHMCFF